jgi:hypothetical protein
MSTDLAPMAQAVQTRSEAFIRSTPHTNAVVEAAHLRARDEQVMQNGEHRLSRAFVTLMSEIALQNAQYRAGIYNPDIEPEHEAERCWCTTCTYKRAKWARLPVQRAWWKATAYPGSLFCSPPSPSNFVPSR